MASNRKMLQRILKHRGYSCELAVDGADAIRVFKERNGDLNIIFMDSNMPVKVRCSVSEG